MNENFEAIATLFAILILEMLLLWILIEAFQAARRWTNKRRVQRWEAMRAAESTRAAREREAMLRRDADAARLHNAQRQKEITYATQWN